MYAEEFFTDVRFGTYRTTLGGAHRVENLIVVAHVSTFSKASPVDGRAGSIDRDALFSDNLAERVLWMRRTIN
jgi:hypothetical protein